MNQNCHCGIGYKRSITGKDIYSFLGKTCKIKKNSNKGIGVRWNKMCKFAGIDP